MVRNNEPWLLGEPELNDRGLPVIHNIAEKLGCIRPSPDLPCAFPEDESEFAELQRSLFANKLGAAMHDDHASDDESERKSSEDSARGFAHRDRADRASSSESEHSADYSSQAMWPQANGLPFTPGLFFKMEPGRPSISTAFDNSRPRGSVDSPVYSDFAASAGATDSPMFRAESPFADGTFNPGWNDSPVADDYMTSGQVLDMTALYMQQQEQRQYGGVPVMVSGRSRGGFMANGGFVPNGDGTIRPAMLDGRMGGNVEGLDGSWGVDYEAMTMG